MKDKATYTQPLFSSIADRYDLLDTLLSFNRDKYWRRLAAAKAELKSGGIALDVATGTGKLALELARGNNTRIIGVDFCQGMLLKAKMRLNGNIELALARAESLPFSDNAFDCATIGFALRNVTDIGKTLQEMIRVVKVGGKVVCLEFSPPQHRLFGRIYRFYLFHLLPFIGGLISKNREAYAYLPQSIVEFSSPEELRQIMEKAGLKGVQIYPLTQGIATVHEGTKG
jgi:demethylmenaquinone methyltransferase/2-methoxy-6-polyprenyl-1,4-benzoquinol methylase